MTEEELDWVGVACTVVAVGELLQAESTRQANTANMIIVLDVAKVDILLSFDLTKIPKRIL
jgi:hypothetical protein